jgi:drug/metabolite transporter (DMT)-like permease
VTVLLSLVAAACYGLSDFVGGAASRRTSVWAVGLLACAGALVGSVLVALFDPGHPQVSDFAWAALGGLATGAGTAFLYRGLAAGRMGVVAPVSGVGSAVVPLVVAVATGERPSALGWIGILLALPGIWWVSREAEPGAGSGGLVDGALAGLGFGTMFAALGQMGTDAGYWPLVGTQLSAAVGLCLIARLLGGDPVPRRRIDLAGFGAGLLAVLAVLFFLLATHRGLLSVAAVITALYPAFTVVLAIALLRERIHRTQALGLAVCAVSVVLVSLA